MNLQLTCLVQFVVRIMRLEFRTRLPALLLLPIFLPNPAATAHALQRKTLVHDTKNLQTQSKNKDTYVGSQVCASCHMDIYNHYVQTGMARSMSSITPALLQQLHIPATFDDQKLNRHFDIYARDGKLYQSEFELDDNGNEVFRDTHPVEWVVGSGANTIGGVIKRGDYLFEAPVALYTKPMTWTSAPGYEFADYSFSRPILTGCIVCHSGRVNPVPNTNGRYKAVPFSELAIGCENCHGPGAAHIRAVMSGNKLNEKNLAIVNPEHLTAESANETCMECHGFGDVRVLQQGKSYLDIRPGTPLDNVLSILMIPPTRESPPRSEQLQHYYLMTLSKCYRASGGQLRCITCHDPHVQPTPQEAPAFFNKRCLTCHTDQSCSLSRIARQQGNPSDNCIGCHMPKRNVPFIAHTSLTNHRIVARPDEPLPEAMYHQTTTALPDLIHLNPAPGKKAAPPSLLTLLQAYAELAAYKPEYVAPYFKVLDQLERTNPNNALVQAALGSRDLKNGKLSEAADHLRRSLQIGPPQAPVYGLLSEALEKLGRNDEALSVQQKAVAQDPYNPLLQRRLVAMLMDRKQYANAQAAIKRYLEVFPQDSSMRDMLAVSKGKTPLQ